MKITFSSIYQVFKKCDKSAFHPSLFHGFLTGLIAGDVQHHLEAETAIECFAPEYKTHPFLMGVFTQTSNQLKETIFDFDMLLPKDTQLITTRTEALVLWCQGFLSGLNQLKIHANSIKSKDFNEIYSDLVRITQAEVENLPESEENNLAYEELHEYIRMSVILLYQELREGSNQTLKQQRHKMRAQLH